MIAKEIRAELFRLQDAGYRELQLRTIPTLAPDTVIGVRTPALRAMAKEWGRRPDIRDFLDALPHACFDENQLHAFIIAGIRDYPGCLAAVERFLPCVDNWATCDQLSPKVFRKHRGELMAPIRRWITGGETYTVRFGIGMLMQHYLDDAFDPACPALAASVRSEEYYVRMMVAWYFATALAKQYDAVIPYLEGRRLDPWTHNKTIRKAIESFRVTPEHKEYLRSLAVKGGQA